MGVFVAPVDVTACAKSGRCSIRPGWSWRKSRPFQGFLMPVQILIRCAGDEKYAFVRRKVPESSISIAYVSERDAQR